MGRLDATFTAERLCEALDYDQSTGIFTWRTPMQTGGRTGVGQVAGRISSEGYRNIGLGGVRCQAHRLAWLYVHGDWPTGQIDHINGIKTDNRIANLRVVTEAQNKWNRLETSRNTSGHRGVSRNKLERKWKAYITVEGATQWLGTFASYDEAVEARLAAERHQFGEYSPSARRAS